MTLGDTTLDFEITPGHTPGTTSIRVFLEDLERIRLIPGIEVQITNHFDIHATGAPNLFERAALLANREPGEPHPWVAPDDFHRWLDELIAHTREQLARAK